MNLASRRALAPLGCVALLACADAPDFPSSSPRDRTTTGAELPGEGPSGGDAPRATEPGRHDAVVFLHGTGDNDATKYACKGTGDDFHCAVPSALDEYWEKGTIDSERTRADGTKRAYAVLGCPLGSETPWPNPTPARNTSKKPEPGSGACVGAQISKFLDGPDGAPGTADDITDIVLVTHSGGSNVVRYVLQQRAAKPEFAKVHAATRGFIGIAAPNHGTFLADWMFTFGSLGNLTSGVMRLFGGEGFYDDDGVAFIRTTQMALSNRDPAKLVDLGKDVAGVPAYMASGTFPDAKGEEAKIACAGKAETLGLAFLHERYLGKLDPVTWRDECSDGFINCRSAMALANGDEERVIFGRLDSGKIVGNTRFRAHNQSRRTCDGLDKDIRKKIQEILDRGPSAPKAGARADAPASRAATRLEVSSATFTRFAPSGSPALEVDDARPDLRLRVGAPARIEPGQVFALDVALDGAREDESPSITAVLESPSRRARLPATITHESGRLVARAALPADAEPGAWTAHVTAGSGAVTRDAALAFEVTRVVARLRRVEARAVSGGIEITADVDATTASRLGLRATIVRDAFGTTHLLDASQIARDVTKGRARLSMHVPTTDLAGVRVLDVAIVRHDDASTQALVGEVPIAR